MQYQLQLVINGMNKINNIDIQAEDIQYRRLKHPQKMISMIFDAQDNSDINISQSLQILQHDDYHQEKIHLSLKPAPKEARLDNPSSSRMQVEKRYPLSLHKPLEKFPNISSILTKKDQGKHNLEQDNDYKNRQNLDPLKGKKGQNIGHDNNIKRESTQIFAQSSKETNPSITYLIDQNQPMKNSLIQGKALQTMKRLLEKEKLKNQSLKTQLKKNEGEFKSMKQTYKRQVKHLQKAVRYLIKQLADKNNEHALQKKNNKLMNGKYRELEINMMNTQQMLAEMRRKRQKQTVSMIFKHQVDTKMQRQQFERLLIEKDKSISNLQMQIVYLNENLEAYQKMPIGGSEYNELVAPFRQYIKEKSLQFDSFVKMCIQDISQVIKSSGKILQQHSDKADPPQIYKRCMKQLKDIMKHQQRDQPKIMANSSNFTLDLEDSTTERFHDFEERQNLSHYRT